MDYLLRDVPADVWRRAKAHAAREGTTLRALLLDGLTLRLAMTRRSTLVPRRRPAPRERA